MLWKAQKCHKIWLNCSGPYLISKDVTQVVGTFMKFWHPSLFHFDLTQESANLFCEGQLVSILNSKSHIQSGLHILFGLLVLFFKLLSFPHTPSTIVEVTLSLRAVCWQVWPDSHSFLMIPGSYSLISVKVSTRILRSWSLIGNKDWLWIQKLSKNQNHFVRISWLHGIYNKLWTAQPL